MVVTQYTLVVPGRKNRTDGVIAVGGTNRLLLEGDGQSRSNAQGELSAVVAERADLLVAERFERGDLALPDDPAEGGVGGDGFWDGGGRVWVGVVGEGELADPVERVGDEDGDGDFEDGAAVAIPFDVLRDGWAEDERLWRVDLPGAVVAGPQADGGELRFDGGENLADGRGGHVRYTPRMTTILGPRYRCNAPVDDGRCGQLITNAVCEPIDMG